MEKSSFYVRTEGGKSATHHVAMAGYADAYLTK